MHEFLSILTLINQWVAHEIDWALAFESEYIRDESEFFVECKRILWSWATICIRIVKREERRIIIILLELMWLILLSNVFNRSSVSTCVILPIMVVFLWFLPTCRIHQDVFTWIWYWTNWFLILCQVTFWNKSYKLFWNVASSKKCSYSWFMMCYVVGLGIKENHHVLPEGKDGDLGVPMHHY